MSNIDEKARNNFTIEMRIFENYEKLALKDLERIIGKNKIKEILDILL